MPKRRENGASLASRHHSSQGGAYQARSQIFRQTICAF